MSAFHADATSYQLALFDQLKSPDQPKLSDQPMSSDQQPTLFQTVMREKEIKQREMFDQEIRRYRQIINDLTFVYDERHNTATRHVLPLPRYMNNYAPLTASFRDALMKQTSKVISIIPMSQLLVKLTDDEIIVVKRKFLQQHASDANARSIFYQTLSNTLKTRINVYSQKGTLKIPITDQTLTLCRCEHGDEDTMADILQTIRQYGFFVTSEHDMTAITDDIIIKFEY
jgi:hypothetical protein